MGNQRLYRLASGAVLFYYRENNGFPSGVFNHTLCWAETGGMDACHQVFLCITR